MGHLKTFMDIILNEFLYIYTYRKYGHVLKLSLKFSFFCFQDNHH